MSQKRLLSAAIAVFGLANPAFAQFTGPSDVQSDKRAEYAPTTVEAIKSDPKDDMKATLEGRIVRKLAHEEYLFADDTGEIRVEIDDEDFPDQPVAETTRVRLV